MPRLTLRTHSQNGHGRQMPTGTLSDSSLPYYILFLVLTLFSYLLWVSVTQSESRLISQHFRFVIKPLFRSGVRDTVQRLGYCLCRDSVFRGVSWSWLVLNSTAFYSTLISFTFHSHSLSRFLSLCVKDNSFFPKNK